MLGLPAGTWAVRMRCTVQHEGESKPSEQGQTFPVSASRRAAALQIEGMRFYGENLRSPCSQASFPQGEREGEEAAGASSVPEWRIELRSQWRYIYFKKPGR